jgi:hypothetical protein
MDHGGRIQTFWTIFGKPLEGRVVVQQSIRVERHQGVLDPGGTRGKPLEQGQRDGIRIGGNEQKGGGRSFLPELDGGEPHAPRPSTQVDVLGSGGQEHRSDNFRRSDFLALDDLLRCAVERPGQGIGSLPGVDVGDRGRDGFWQARVGLGDARLAGEKQRNASRDPCEPEGRGDWLDLRQVGIHSTTRSCFPDVRLRGR